MPSRKFVKIRVAVQLPVPKKKKRERRKSNDDIKQATTKIDRAPLGIVLHPRSENFSFSFYPSFFFFLSFIPLWNVQIKRKDVIKTSVCVTNWITTEAWAKTTMGEEKKIARHGWREVKITENKKIKKRDGVRCESGHVIWKSVISRMQRTRCIIARDFSTIDGGREIGDVRGIYYNRAYVTKRNFGYFLWALI